MSVELPLAFMSSLTVGLEPGALLMMLAIMAVAGYLHTVSGFGLGPGTGGGGQFGYPSQQYSGAAWRVA